MINRKFIIVFIICFFLYLLSDIFIADTFLYLWGGIFGSIARWLGITQSFPFIWLSVLVVLAIVYIKGQNKFFKITLIILLWMLLYLLDIFIYKLISEITSKMMRNFFVISAFLKSLTLSWIYKYR